MEFEGKETLVFLHDVFVGWALIGGTKTHQKHPQVFVEGDFGNFEHSFKIHLCLKVRFFRSGQFAKSRRKVKKSITSHDMCLCDISICSCLAKRLTKPAIHKLLVSSIWKEHLLIWPVSCRISFLNPSFKDFLVWFSLKDLCSTTLMDTPRTQSRKVAWGVIRSSYGRSKLDNVLDSLL